MPEPDRDTPTAEPAIIRRFIRPVEFEAAQFTGDGDSAKEIAAWVGVPYSWWKIGASAGLTLHTVYRDLFVGPGDWVVCDGGETRVVRCLAFAYEPAPEAAA